MPVVRHGEHHRVDVLPGHHLPVVVVSFAITVVIMPVDRVHGLLQGPLVQVAGGDDLTVLLGHEALGVARPHHAPANDAHHDAIGGRGVAVFAERTGGDKRRPSDGGCGCGDEMTTRKLGRSGGRFHKDGTLPG